MQKLFLCFGLVAFLSACSGEIKESLGMTKVSPDEYTVISNPPLSMPPDFKLRAPEEDDVTFKALNSIKAASILKEKNFDSHRNSKEKKFSVAEENLLIKAGVNNKNSDIRKLIAEDVRETNKKEQDSTLGKFYYNYLKQKQDPAIDPYEEKKNLEDQAN